ncbi:hypothetical protein D0T49_06030 [Paludibacter sp. 221]|uniref:hypothetical protein n=1 Tax=Paludibacter sp. 221 TaxID=2302939 RepID=UPI0013D07D34|nr:hypothetical protein [Paludibacter sp. 221]NDV46601.1 hypothetical protein [Paludibacter sp. 221]
MPLEYINRKKKAHYVKVSLTKNGKERYYIIKDKSKLAESELLTDMPRGYEFYEQPEDALVVFRKIVKSSVSKEEMMTVDSVMQELKLPNDYIIDRGINEINVYLDRFTKKENKDYFRDNIHLYQYYNLMLRFVKSGRNYKAERFCHLLRFHGWITIETSDDLEFLAKKYCYHINKESLYDFWIEGEEDY